jgi:hypothetical protein
VSTTGVPVLARIARWTCDQPVTSSPRPVSATRDTGRPSTATIVSPARSPATAAGEGGASAGQVVEVEVAGSTHSGIDAIVVVDPGMPKPTRTTVKKTTASSRLWNGPANITMTRCHQGLR